MEVRRKLMERLEGWVRLFFCWASEILGLDYCDTGLLPESVPASWISCLYPCPSGRVSADIRAHGQDCHP